MEKIYIKTDYIKLQQALKLARIADQGSDAKLMIQEGFVYVNGEKCLMRGKKLKDGDIVKISGDIFEDNKDMEFIIKSYGN